jgi:hypothetical protein
MTVISAHIRVPESAIDTHIPLIEWEDCPDVVRDPLGTSFDGECAEHDGCHSIL